MDLLTHLLIISTFDLIFVGECRLVYINKNLTFIGAWERCHKEYKGHLADVGKWTYSSQSLQSHCLETDDFFWHGSLTKSLPWISFEGCYRYLDYSKAITMPYTSLAWCQNYCMLYHPKRSSFAVNINQCLCDLYLQYGHPADSKHCSIPCDDNAMCGGDGYISLYKRAPISTHHMLDLESPENIGKRCLVFKCASRTNVTYEVANCADQLSYICVNRSGTFHSLRREPWLTTNMLCSKMLAAPVCTNVTMSGDLIRWTHMFRVQYQFKDKVPITLAEVETFLKSSFYTNDRKGRRIALSDGRKEYPSLCETDISDEKLIDEDRVCRTKPPIEIASTEHFTNATTSNSTNESEESTAQTDPLGFEILVVIGPFICVLLTEVGFVFAYCIFKKRRQQRERDTIELHIRTPQAGGIASGATTTESSSLFSDINTRVVERNVLTNNLPVNKFARITDGERANVSVADNSVLQSKARNDGLNNVSHSDVNTDYNEINDACIEDIGRRNQYATNYMDDGGYTEIDPGQTESETGNCQQRKNQSATYYMDDGGYADIGPGQIENETGTCEQSVYSEILSRVYETSNEDRIDNVHEQL